eukprot:15475251-Alexandrium_andersonii.AAC.1
MAESMATNQWDASGETERSSEGLSPSMPGLVLGCPTGRTESAGLKRRELDNRGFAQSVPILRKETGTCQVNSLSIPGVAVVDSRPCRRGCL